MRVLAAVAMVALVAACSGGSRKGSQPPATAPGPNPDVIPAVITPAYVDAVFKVLNHINGNAVRALVASRQLSPPVNSALHAVYADPLYAVELRVFEQGLSTGLANVRVHPGDRTTRVVRLISWTESCIFVQTSSDLSAVEVKPGPPAASEYWKLGLKTESADPTHLNPTPWALSDNEDYTVPTTVVNRC